MRSELHIDLWIDDLSFDVVERDPANAVRIALAAFERIKTLLEQDNLKISEKKAGFVVSNTAAKRMLQEKLAADGPKVHDVMRDLGVDCTAGRLRRIMTIVYDMNGSHQHPPGLWTFHGSSQDLQAILRQLAGGPASIP